ncbi:ATP-binding protein [Ideonella sp. DXS29W]|uniref:histidine kinase n=1 Tax=Ideonella lacteola TaxID=2984193 RepID=A0ABU9BSI9_9BURK
MAFERTRLLAAALLWAGAGATAATAAGSARAWVAVVVLAVCGVAVAWPLARRPAVATLVAGSAGSAELSEAAPAPDRLHVARLQAQLEHLPVAAWALGSEALQPLTSRARRLEAPGGVRDKVALHALLRRTTESGPVVLDSERGNERWQLRRQPLALDGREQVLLALVPLEHELETESLLAWRQLVQVLTHEIMNSLTPIKSLSQTAATLLDEPGTEAELRTALNAIALRAESLSNFVTTYRQVSRWPEPVMAPVDLQALFARLDQAVGPAWRARGGEASFELGSPGLRLQADEGQLEQALLALFTNAEQATADLPQPRLWVQARQGRGGRLQISVRDNGPGVPPGMEREIFLPFFSAREGGQGIGLTVVRQLVHGMGGRVRHVRPLEGGAAFVMSF